MPKLRAVIITLNQASLSQTHRRGEIHRRLPFYKFFYDYEYKELTPMMIEYYSLYGSVGFKRTIQLISQYLVYGSSSIKCDQSGWMGEGGNKSVALFEFKVDAKKAAIRHSAENVTSLQNMEVFSSIAEWAKQSKISLYFVNTPKTKFYLDEINKAELEIMNGELNNLLAGNKFSKYYDFSSSPEFELRDFQNADHLNENGARKLTKILNELILE